MGLVLLGGCDRPAWVQPYWFLIFAAMLALLLGIKKRKAELRLVKIKANKPGADENFAEKIEKLTKSADTVLTVVNHDQLFPKRLIQKEMNDLYNLDSQVNFTYFKIYRFSRKKN